MVGVAVRKPLLAGRTHRDRSLFCQRRRNTSFTTAFISLDRWCRNIPRYRRSVGKLYLYAALQEGRFEKGKLRGFYVSSETYIESRDRKIVLSTIVLFCFKLCAFINKE